MNMWTSKRVNSEWGFELLFWNRDVFSCVCTGFINDLPYKSDEMAHVAFPDERYNKPKLTTTCRDGVWDAPHM